jgi:hypothetical protein
MSLSAKAWGAKSTDTIKMPTVSSPDVGVSLLVMYRTTCLPKKDKATGIRQAGPNDFTKFFAVPMQGATVSWHQGKDKGGGDIAKMLATGTTGTTAEVHEPMVLKPFECSWLFKIFNKPVGLVPGRIYELRGVVYNEWKPSATEPVQKSLRASSIVASDKSFFDYYPSIPFAVRTPKFTEGENESHFFALPIENQAQARNELLEAGGPLFLGRLKVHDELDSTHLTRKNKEGVESIGYTDGLNQYNGAKNPIVDAFLQEEGAAEGKRVGLMMPFYHENVDPLHLDMPAWRALACKFLPVLTGLMAGSLDAKGTSKIDITPELRSEFDQVADTFASIVLNVPLMIQRAGFQIDPAHVGLFVKGALWGLRHPDWAVSPMRDDYATPALNLMLVEGDVRRVLAQAHKGLVDIYVVLNHGMDDDEMAMMRMLPLAERAPALQSKSARVHGRAVYAVYAVAAGVRQLVGEPLLEAPVEQEEKRAKTE